MLPGPSPVPGPVPGRPLPPRPAAPPDAEQPLAPAVAAALTHLEQLDAAPVAEHVDVLDTVHHLLQDALTMLDEV